MASIKKRRISLVVLSAAGASAALLLSACGGGTPTATGNMPSSEPSSSASPATTASSSPSSTAGSSAPAAPNPAPAPVDNGLCKAGDVSLSLGQGDSGAGSSYRPLDIKNISGQACTIQGFPGVSYVGGSDGQQIGPAAFRSGEKGDAIKLSPGQTAVADLQFVQVQNFDAGVCKPTPVKGLRVYLPQETASKFVADPGTGCAGGSLPGNQLSVKSVHRS